MTILTGFSGMSVDKEGFVRAQIGWSIHCFDSAKKKEKGAKGAKGSKTDPNA
jgi:hypothetical protein